MTEQPDEFAERQDTWKELVLRELKVLSDVAAGASLLIATDRPADAYFAFVEDSRAKTDAIERALRYVASIDVKARLHGEGQANV